MLYIEAAYSLTVHEGDNVAGLAVHGLVELVHAVEAPDFAAAVLLGQLVAYPLNGLIAYVEYYPVNGLEYYAVVMYVLELYQAVAGGVLVLCGEALLGLYPLPVGLCGSEGMVAVAHCEEQGRLIGVILFGVCVFIDQSGEGVDRALYLALVLYEVALYVAALLHKVEIIQPFGLVQPLAYGFYNGALGVVYEYQYMGHLQRSVLPYPEAGRYTLDYSALGSADKCG